MKKREIFKQIKKHFSAEDLDEHIHELKCEEAADINNSGIDTQLEYLYEKAGADWLIEIFCRDST